MSAFSYQGLTFLDTLFSMRNISTNKYYLCADIHHYQSSELTLNNHNLKQIVVGTGGKRCDPINKEVMDISYNTNLTVHPIQEDTGIKEQKLHNLNIQIEDIQDKHGYLECEINESNHFSYEFSRNRLYIRGGRKAVK